MQSERIVELDNTKTYTIVVKKINGSNSKNVSVSLQKNVNTVAEAVTISPSSTDNYKSFTESDGLYRGWIYIPAETICNELELEIMVLEGNYNLGNAPIFEKYGQSPSIEYKSEVKAVTGDVRLFVKNKDNSENQEVTLSLGNKTLYKGDKILRKDGKWYFSYIWKTINDFSRLSAEGIGLTGKRRGWLPVSGNFKITDKNNNKNGGMSNVTTLAQAGQTYNGQIGFTVGNIDTQKRLFIYLEELSDIQTSQEFREVLSELGAYFVLPLEEPELEPIEDINLINQLNKLLRLKQYEEVTNIDLGQDVIFEIDIDLSEIRVLKEINIEQNIEIEKLKEDINYKDKIISGLQGGQVEEMIEGDNITIHDCLELPVKIYNYENESKQEILHINSNLFDESNTTNGIAINSNGIEVILSTFRISEFIRVKNLISYNLSFLAQSGESQTVRVHFYDENKNWLSQVSIVSSKQTERISFKFETPQNCKFIRVSIYNGFLDVMVSEGSENIQYIEHRSESILIEQLNKLRIFTYRGTNHFIVTSKNGQTANLKIEVYKDSIKILNDKIYNLEQTILNS